MADRFEKKNDQESAAYGWVGSDTRNRDIELGQENTIQAKPTTLREKLQHPVQREIPAQQSNAGRRLVEDKFNSSNIVAFNNKEDMQQSSSNDPAFCDSASSLVNGAQEQCIKLQTDKDNLTARFQLMKRTRFSAHERLESKHHTSFLAITMLSFFIFALSIYPILYEHNLSKDNITAFVSSGIISTVFIMIMSTIISSKNYRMDAHPYLCTWLRFNMMNLRSSCIRKYRQ